MKKFLRTFAILTAVSALFTFASCSSDDSSGNGSTSGDDSSSSGTEVSRWTNTITQDRYKMTYNSDGSSYGFPDGTKVEIKQTLVFMSNNVVKAIYEADIDEDGTTDTFETTKNLMPENNQTMKYSGNTAKDGEIILYCEDQYGRGEQGQATISGSTLTFTGDFWPAFEAMTKGDYKITFDCYANGGVFTKATE